MSLNVAFSIAFKQAVNVKVGDTVTWTNDDNQAHTVTSGKDSSDPDAGKVFDSSPNFNPLLAPKQTFQHKFTTAGEVPYFGQLHPTMIGTVVVSQRMDVQTPVISQ